VSVYAQSLFFSLLKKKLILLYLAIPRSRLFLSRRSSYSRDSKQNKNFQKTNKYSMLHAVRSSCGSRNPQKKTHFLSLKCTILLLLLKLAVSLPHSVGLIQILSLEIFFSPLPIFFSIFLCGEFIKKRYLRIVDIISFSFILFFSRVMNTLLTMFTK
jgi:hypothetical protein